MTHSSSCSAKARAAKDDLLFGKKTGLVDLAGSDGHFDGLAPTQGLEVNFASVVEMLNDHLLASVLLGLGLAVTVLIGPDRREKRRTRDPASAPL